jgi:hypothetical protein
MQSIEKKTAGTFIYGIGNIEVDIVQIGKPVWLKEIETFVTSSQDSFTIIAIQKPELKNPLFLQRAIQAFVNHIQAGGEEQKANMIRTHFRNWINKQNGSLKDITNGTKTGNTEADRQSGRDSLKEAFAKRYS